MTFENLRIHLVQKHMQSVSEALQPRKTMHTYLR